MDWEDVLNVTRVSYKRSMWRLLVKQSRYFANAQWNKHISKKGVTVVVYILVFCMIYIYSYYLFSGSYNPDGLNGRCYYCPQGYTTKGNKAKSADDCTGEMGHYFCCLFEKNFNNMLLFSLCHCTQPHLGYHHHDQNQCKIAHCQTMNQWHLNLNIFTHRMLLRVY